tara:strand:- start:32 stop:322 length:291 start_codon:yes stop_codon:yes gene_type:complete
MNYKIINISLTLSALSAMIVAGTFLYKTFYYDPLNQWKLVADKKNHVYVVRNRGEEICYFDYRKSDMNTGKNNNNLTITGSSGRNITGKWVKTNCK